LTGDSKRSLFFSISSAYSHLVVEGGVRLGNLGLKSLNLLGLGVGVPLDHLAGRRSRNVSCGNSSRYGIGTTWDGGVEVAGGGVWLSGGRVGVVVGDGSGLLSGAGSARLTVLGAVGAIADLLGAVDTLGTVGSVARRESSDGLDDDGVPLGVVERLALHGNVLTKVLITVHAGGEELVISGSARDSSNTELLASAELDEASSGWPRLLPGGLVEERRSITELDGGSSSEEGSQNELFHGF
jgi:hypothetical protein